MSRIAVCVIVDKSVQSTVRHTNMQHGLMESL